MKKCRIVCLALLLTGLVSAAPAQQGKKSGIKISDETFRQVSATFLNDPTNKSASDWSRLIMLYTLDSPKDAEVAFGSDEWSWAGLDGDDSHALLLLAAYSSGNLLSQLNSGVKRNDRYSGVLTLFRVYRTLCEKKKQLKIDVVDKLLELHKENKLLAHLRELDKKKAAKLTPAEEAGVRRLMRTR
jgi:hypothetical protein